MLRVEFEPTISAFERTKIVHALDRAATLLGLKYEIAPEHYEIIKLKFFNFSDIRLHTESIFRCWDTGKTETEGTDLSSFQERWQKKKKRGDSNSQFGRKMSPRASNLESFIKLRNMVLKCVLCGPDVESQAIGASRSLQAPHLVPLALGCFPNYDQWRTHVYSQAVATRSKAWTIFAHSEAVIVGSNPTQGMDVWCVCLFILCLCCHVFR
jgi:hypothetical protein